ncbi:hypothetical protein D3C73_1057810 [compost metagenome]
MERLGRDPGLRRGDGRTALRLGHDAAGHHRRPAAGRDLYPRHAQYVDHGHGGRGLGPGLPADGQFVGRLLFRPASPSRERVFDGPGGAGRDHGQAALALPDGAQGRLGLRPGLPGDLGRPADERDDDSGGDPAVQAGRHLYPGPPHRPAAPRGRGAARAPGRRRAIAAQPDPALLPVPYAEEAGPDRARHVGHVADRPDDLPHPVSSGGL